MAYQYRGTKHDIDEPPPVIESGRGKKFDGFNPDACGTYAGYGRHIKWGVPPCRDCKDAMAAYSRDRYKPKKPKEQRTFKPDKCGTWAGHLRHRYHNTPPCEPCREAARQYQREWRAKRAQERSKRT